MVGLEQRSLDVFLKAVKKLDAGFADLPAFDAWAAGTQDERIGAALKATAERLQDNYPYFHPLYAGQMLKPPHPAARLAYALAMWINPNNHALDGGRATSAMEKEAVAEIAAMFGWKAFLGHLCGGGTMANLEALWVASQVQPGKKILASEQAHYTHRRISAVLQLGFESVACDANGRMDVKALTSRVARGDVGTVVATMGTTATGSVDPLPEILALREKHGFRIHADAAYGGYFAWRRIWGSRRRGVLPESEKRIPSLSILTSMGCSLTAAAVFCFATRPRDAFTSTILLTPISARRSCIWARSAWSVPGREPQRRRCGRRKSYCHWSAAGSSPADWKPGGRQR